MEFPIIETERLILRQIVESDLQNIFKGLSDPMVTQYYGISFETLEATKEQMVWFRELEEKKTGRWWAVCTKEEGLFCGAGGFNDWSRQHKKAEIGFWLLPQFWGKGYLKEAMSQIMDHGFNEMNMHRIEGYVDANNTKCKSAIDKVEMVHEGTMRECEMKGNEFVSIAIYSKLKG